VASVYADLDVRTIGGIHMIHACNGGSVGSVYAGLTTALSANTSPGGIITGSDSNMRYDFGGISNGIKLGSSTGIA